VLKSNQPEMPSPKRRNIEVRATSGLVEWSHAPRCEKSTVPSSVEALRKNPKATISHARTQKASE
jgi:hypothetical protein